MNQKLEAFHRKEKKMFETKIKPAMRKVGDT